MNKKIIIVGAGLTGSVLAERITSVLRFPVTIIEKRSHIGGNCWSEIDDQTGIEYHKYGPHIFHTSKKEVWDYISRFTEWNNYYHTGWTRYNDKIYSLPINLQTINKFYELELSPAEAERLIRNEIAKENIAEPENLEEKAISLIGRPLYEAFIKGYTIKQWDKDPKELAPEIITRLPVRYNYSNRYFNDKWEGIPLEGYAALFNKLLSSPLIEIRLNTSWFDIRDSLSPDHMIFYTGPIDKFFDYKFGRLEWRTVKFEKLLSDSDYQGTAIINEANAAIPYTRTSEYKYFHPERKVRGTVIFKEFSQKATGDDEPYYPINTPANSKKLKEYLGLARTVKDKIHFCGRLGTYAYLDMDACIGNALKLFETFKLSFPQMEI